MKTIKEEGCKALDALMDMAEPPTLEPIMHHVAKQVRAASLIGIITGKAVTISITPQIKDDGLIHGFDAKMDAMEHLEAIGQMTLDEALGKMSAQLAENIRRENCGPDISDFLNRVLSKLGEDDEDGDDETAPAEAPAESDKAA